MIKPQNLPSFEIGSKMMQDLMKKFPKDQKKMIDTLDLSNKMKCSYNPKCFSSSNKK